MLTNHSASSLAALGAVTECHGVQLRAQLRSVAIFVQVTGHLTPANRDRVADHLRRFALVGGAMVLDLADASGVDDEFTSCLSAIADLTLVLDPVRHHGVGVDGSVAITGSWGDAMRGITARHTLLVQAVSRR